MALKYDPSFGGHDAVVQGLLEPGESVTHVSHGGYGPVGTARPTNAKLYVTTGRVLIIPSRDMRTPQAGSAISIRGEDFDSVPKVKSLLTARATFSSLGIELFGPKKFIRQLAEAVANFVAAKRSG